MVLARWFASALGGRCEQRPELAARPLPLEVSLAAVPCRGGDAFLRRLFEPLGYEVDAVQHPLDEALPSLGASQLFTLTLRAEKRLADVLAHVYVLIPVLDDRKHYWVGGDEVDKLLRRGEGWLDTHPARDEIVSRYLVRQRGLVREALARLTQDEDPDEEATATARDEAEVALERPLSLNERRLDAVFDVLKASGATRVIDLGCGEGKLLRRLLADRQFVEITGMDVSARTLDHAEDRLKLDRLAPAQRERIRLLHGSLVYRDTRLAGFDAAAVMEVVEHLDASRLRAFERVGVRVGTAGDRRRHHAERRIQRPLAVAPGWPAASRRPPLRVDARRVRGVGRRCRRPDRLRGPFRGDRRRGRGGRHADADGGVHAMTLTIPELALVVLIGPSGCGKSTFARRHFAATEVLSSDGFRGLVSDDENDQTATDDAFAALHFVAARRLARGRLTVVDATNVQPEARKPLIALAREYHVLPVALVLDLPERVCHERNRSRTDRAFGPHVIRHQRSQLHRSLRGLGREGFRHVHVLSSEEAVDAATITRQPLWNNRKSDHGPFDIIGDVHGCADELEALLGELGYRRDARRALAASRRAARRCSSAISSTAARASSTRCAS